MKAHDVRKLRLCGVCGGLGYLPHMLTLTLPNGEKPDNYHGARGNGWSCWPGEAVTCPRCLAKLAKQAEST